MYQSLIEKGFDLSMLQHAGAILESEFPDALEELQSVLTSIEIPIKELVSGGGGKSEVVKRIEAEFYTLNWKKHNFELKKLVDNYETLAMSHEIDHVKKFEKGTIALEIEWNNKDPFFDRDLQNFKNLHADGAISLGMIITRGASFQNSIKDKISKFAKTQNIRGFDALKGFYTPTNPQKKAILTKIQAGFSFEDVWAEKFVSSKFGQSTTHWDKLIDRVNRGIGNPCPLVLIGIPISVIKD